MHRWAEQVAWINLILKLSQQQEKNVLFEPVYGSIKKKVDPSVNTWVNGFRWTYWLQSCTCWTKKITYVSFRVQTWSWRSFHWMFYGSVVSSKRVTQCNMLPRVSQNSVCVCVCVKAGLTVQLPLTRHNTSYPSIQTLWAGHWGQERLPENQERISRADLKNGSQERISRQTDYFEKHPVWVLWLGK